MAYATVSEIEAFTSYSHTDFRKGGVVMTQEQWNVLLDILIDGATASINKFCGVETFGIATHAELHSGKPRDGETGGILESTRNYYLHHFPVISITSVEEDTAPKISAPNWVTRVRRGTGVAGDYELVIFGSKLSYIRFHNNFPRAEVANIRITYRAGFPVGSDELNFMKTMTCQIVANALALKKKLQEAIAARNVGTRDAEEMFQITDPRIFTESLQKELIPFRRMRVPGSKSWR